jgi:hypothetical protein
VIAADDLHESKQYKQPKRHVFIRPSVTGRFRGDLATDCTLPGTISLTCRPTWSSLIDCDCDPDVSRGDRCAGLGEVDQIALSSGVEQFELCFADRADGPGFENSSGRVVIGYQNDLLGSQAETRRSASDLPFACLWGFEPVGWSEAVGDFARGWVEIERVDVAVGDHFSVGQYHHAIGVTQNRFGQVSGKDEGGVLLA